MPSLGDASLVHLTAKQLCKGTFWVVWVDVAGIGMPMLDFITSLTEKMQTGRAFKIKDHISVARKQLKTESRLTTYQHCSSSNTIFLRKRSVFFLCLPKFCVIVWNLRLSENYQNFFMTGVPPCQRKFLTIWKVWSDTFISNLWLSEKREKILTVRGLKYTLTL